MSSMGAKIGVWYPMTVIVSYSLVWFYSLFIIFYSAAENHQVAKEAFLVVYAHDYQQWACHPQ